MPNHKEVLRNRSGVALPLALIGLVIVSVLVTAALVSSSTGVAVSGAHQDATRGIYAAEEALNRFVGNMAAALRTDSITPPVQGAGDTTLTLPGGSASTVVLRKLYRINPVTVPDVSVTPGRAVYCITATPQRTGGRSSRMVGAFVQMRLTPGDLRLRINGAGSFADTVEVRGNSRIVGQAQNVSLCGANGAVPAIETSADGAVITNGAVDVVGETSQTTETTAEFQHRILGGKTPAEIARLASIKFGPALTPLRNFRNQFRAESSVPRDSVANWGCPASMGAVCSSPHADTTYYPVIGIDANGGQVDLQGDHGQGLLVVINGGLKVSGNFRFKGIVIVQGDLDVTGTMDVVGAVVGLNTVTVGRNDNNNLGGTVRITFDPCVNRRVQQGFNDENPAFVINRPVYGWFEVVR